MSGSPGREAGAGGKRGRGRPRGFDRRAAVEQAMLLFWERGYEGASFNALTASMGLSASSLQNAFGSKEALFREVVRHYAEGPGGWFAEVLAAPVGTREAFERIIAEASARFTGPDLPAGCLVSTAATHAAPDLDSIRAFATQARQESQRALADRVRRGVAEGDVPAGTHADELAAYFMTVFRGMAVQARDGATRAELARIGAYAMRAWPVAAAQPVPEGSGPPTADRA